MGKCSASSAIILLIFLLVIIMVKGSPLMKLQLCGTELANKLAEICAPYGYNDPFSHALRFESPQLDNRTPLRLRVRRGVADECCKTGCTLDTMEQYCGASLTPAERARFIQELQDNRMNHIPQDDADAGDVLPASLEMRRPGKAKEPKNDLISKVDIEELERHQNQIAPVIGTINPSYLGIPVILPSRIRKDEILQDFKRN